MITSTDRIEEALQFIDPRDRDTWVKMGMAIKSELGEFGFELWERWSQQADSFNGRDARDVWKSISRSGRVSIGSLFHEARANGWRPNSRQQQSGSDAVGEQRRLAEERAVNEEAEINRERANTAAKAAAIWNASIEALPDHPYLALKQVSPVTTLREIDAVKAAQILGYSPKCRGEPLWGRLLVVPVKQGDSVSTLELIDGDKRKAALAGRGTKACGYWATRQLPDGDGKGLTVLIGEGVATVLSASQACDYLAVASLSSGNLVAVAKAMRERFPEASLVILADLVKATGQPDAHAMDAAVTVKGRLAVPDFGAAHDPNMTDFNDLALLKGKDVVVQAISASVEIAKDFSTKDLGNNPNARHWADPQPLAAKVEPEPYPLEALPPLIREAVEEVASFVKAPIPMVACSALAAVSLACQAHVDVRRLEKLEGPVGLFILVIADSGERKSTCDSFFSKAIAAYERSKADETKPSIKNYKAASEAWEAKRSGVKERIRQLAKQLKPTSGTELDLADLEHVKPEPPRVPRLLYADATPEALAFGLGKLWPSGGVVSAEAGIVFGSHGMGKDSVMRNLSLLNQLWDGATLTIDRKTTESFIVRGARLTIALQVQEPTIREFFGRSGALARGTGFLARFLVAWPKSTQGIRHINPDAPNGPKSWPKLAAFNQRIAKILEESAPIDKDGSLTPALLQMTPEANAKWVAYHNLIESELLPRGECFDVRDVASKSPDNAARLAALFHTFEGKGGAIDSGSFESASKVAIWHLHEARRFFGELALPVELADAARLDSFLIEQAGRDCQISTRDAQRLGPIRKKENLDEALAVLEELNRAIRVVNQKRKTILVNPALIGAM